MLKTFSYALLFASALTLSANAQVPGKPGVNVEVGKGGVQVDVNGNRVVGDRVGVKADRPTGVVQRSSKITGSTVKNGKGESLGTIYDLVIDLDQGKIRYATLAHGGVLGVGAKYFAIPWRGLHSKLDADGNHHYVLDVDAAVFEKASGFDDSNWPNFADPKFETTNDAFFLRDRAVK